MTQQKTVNEYDQHQYSVNIYNERNSQKTQGLLFKNQWLPRSGALQWYIKQNPNLAHDG